MVCRSVLTQHRLNGEKNNRGIGDGSKFIVYLESTIKMSLLSYAESELNLIGLTEEDEYNAMMRKHILHIIKALTPLTGEDDEWTNVSDYGSGDPLYQNKRLSSVFKEADGSCYNIDGKVFWEWYKDEDGKAIKSHYTCRESRVAVTFPYTVPNEPIYEWRRSDAEPRSPNQTEEGLIDG